MAEEGCSGALVLQPEACETAKRLGMAHFCCLSRRCDTTCNPYTPRRVIARPWLRACGLGRPLPLQMPLEAEYGG